jgi:hypothetical protein
MEMEFALSIKDHGEALYAFNGASGHSVEGTQVPIH